MSLILTDGEHEAVCGDPDEITDRAREQREVRARRHIRQAVVELAEIRTCLTDEDFHRIFNPGARSEHSTPELEHAARGIIRFLYRGLWSAHPEMNVKREMGEEIEAAEVEHLANLDVDPDTVQEAYSRLHDGEPADELTREELEALATASTHAYRSFKTESNPFLWTSARSRDE